MLNSKLAVSYEGIAKEFLATSCIPDMFVGPFLISCPAEYDALPLKWMYVGQETNGWESLFTQQDVSVLMGLHARFNLAKGSRWAGAPFWTFAHELDRNLNPDGPDHSFIWSNIARVGKKGGPGRVPIEHLEFWSTRRLLAEEVRLLLPSLVLFVTGPNYDDLLEREFPNIELPRLSLQQPVIQISHPSLPVRTFRSYHPGFLYRKGLKKSVMDFLITNASV